MKSDCDEAETQLSLTQQSGRTLLDRAGSLREERCVFSFSFLLVFITYSAVEKKSMIKNR
jgi:hypothetical protein